MLYICFVIILTFSIIISNNITNCKKYPTNRFTEVGTLCVIYNLSRRTSTTTDEDSGDVKTDVLYATFVVYR